MVDTMNNAEAEGILRERSRFCLYVRSHCRDRMADRDVTMNDIRYVIQWGSVVSVEWSPEYENWKCEIHGKDIEGDELTLIAAILENGVMCITVY